MDVIPTIAVDPYTSLASKCKLGYTYSFQKDFMTGEEYLVREVPIHSNFSQRRDPLYKDLDSFPCHSISTEDDLNIKKKCPVSVYQDSFFGLKRTFPNYTSSKRLCRML